MVAPTGTGAEFDVLLAFSLDEAANKRVQQRVTTINDELRRIQEEAGKAGKAVNTAMGSTEKKAEAAQKSVTKLGTELARLGERAQQSSRKVDQAVDSNIRKFKQLEEAAKRVRQQAGLISGAAARGSALFGQGLIAGGAVVGGILAEANRFAKEEENAKRATAATREWTQATTELALARRKVDQVLLKEALPLLQQAARIAAQAADFVEKHPEIVQAALKTGLVVAGLSAVGLAITRGIKLVADAAYIAAVATELLAAKIHNQAADKQLAAAAAMKVTNRADDLRKAFGLSGGGAAAGGLAGAATSPLAIVALAGATLAASAKAADGLKTLEERLVRLTVETGKGSGILTAVLAGLHTVLTTLNPLIPAIKTMRTALERDIPAIARLLGLAPAATGGATAGARGGATATATLRDKGITDGLVAAWSAWQEDDARLISEAAENRLKIIEDAERDIASATKQFGQQRVQINRQFDRARAEIIGDYAEDLKKAELDYARSRADIIEDAGEEIQRIEEDHQEAIRKMTLDHNQRVEELTAARDALGLVKEERRFNQERSEAERGVNREIAQRRADTAKRLAELAEEYALERAQRQQQFQQSLKENEARRQEELKAAQAAHEEQLKQIREQKAAQLRELQEGLYAERLRRREMFIAQIRDLDESLLGERGLKVKYYNLMLADAEAWLANYRKALSGGSTSPFTGVTGTVGTRDSGGYADPGIYRIGQREFVMNNSSMRAAERIIGGQLNQDNLVRALSGMGGGKQVSYYDQRRMEMSLSKDQRNAYKQGAMDALQEVLR